MYVELIYTGPNLKLQALKYHLHTRHHRCGNSPFLWGTL